MHLGPYEELIASFNGNVVKIRLPKSTKKPMKLTPSKEALQKQCTCGEGEPVCEATCGRGTDLGDDPTADQLNLQIPDDMCAAYDQRTMLNSELVYGQKPGQNPICNVTPSNAPPGVKACKIPSADKDVFVLKIGKTSDEPQRTLPIEVHLATPKRPGKPKPPLRDCKTIQCEEPPCCPPCVRGPCTSCGSCGPCGPCAPCGRCFLCAPCPPPAPCPRGPCCSPCPPPPRTPRRRRTPCLPCCK